MTIGKTIQFYRKQHQLSQQQLANQIGVSRQTISKWEQDLSLPDIEMLVKMADVFEVSVTSLMGVETEENSLSELYNQIKNVQINLEKANKHKNISQMILILICILSLGVTISTKYQISKQNQAYLEKSTNDTHKIQTVLEDYLNIDGNKRGFMYIDTLKMTHKNTDFYAWTTDIHYELSLKEYSANTSVEITFINEAQAINETYVFEKESDNQFILDKTIPLANYDDIKITINTDDFYQIESISQAHNGDYITCDILKNVEFYVPQDEYGLLDLSRIAYRHYFGDYDKFNAPFYGGITLYVEKGDEMLSISGNLLSEFEYSLDNDKIILNVPKKNLFIFHN